MEPEQPEQRKTVEILELPKGMRGVPWCVLILFVLILGLILMAFTNLLVKFVGRRASSHRSAKACRHPPCNSYPKYLIESVRGDVDPCDNFYLHICGGWERSHKGSFQQNASEMFFENAISALRPIPDAQQTPQQKSAKFFLSCEDIVSKNRNGLNEAKSVMKEAGFAWPHEAENSKVLNAILYMSWRTYRPVVLEVIYTHHASNVVGVAFRPSPIFRGLLEKRDALISSGGYEAYFDVIRTHFAIPGVPSVSFEDVRAMEEHISTVLETLLERTEHLNTTISELSNLTPGISTDIWRTSMRAYRSRLPDNFQVPIRRKYFFGAFFNLTSHYGASRMLRYLGWYAAQDLSKFANRELVANYYGSENDVAKMHRQFCVDVTRNAIGLSFLHDTLKILVHSNLRSNVLSMLENIATSLNGLVTAPAPVEKNSYFVFTMKNDTSSLPEDRKSVV